MKNLLLLVTALFLNAFAFAQLENTDFETWELPINETLSGNRPVGWLRTNGVAGDETYSFYHPPVTEAQSGNYALRLSIWYTYDVDMAIQTAEINYRPAALSGFYTYTDNIVFSHFADDMVNDEARANVRLTKLNNVTGEVEVIGMGTTILPASGSFTAFTCPIIYTSPETPDSIEVVFDCSLMDKAMGGAAFTSPQSFGISSILTIDNISLRTEALSAADLGKQNFKIYPNPATDIIHIPGFNGSATIYDVTGKLIANHRSAVDVIDVTALQSGMYMLSLNNYSGTQVVKLIKQ